MGLSVLHAILAASQWDFYAACTGVCVSPLMLMNQIDPPLMNQINHTEAAVVLPVLDLCDCHAGKGSDGSGKKKQKQNPQRIEESH